MPFAVPTIGCAQAEGGFPEAQKLDGRNRIELLRAYVDVALLRDVVERHNLSQPQVLHWMVRQQLLGSSAGTFSINKFHADFKSRGVAVGKGTLHAYLAHLEDAFLLTSLDLASDSERRRQVKTGPVSRESTDRSDCTSNDCDLCAGDNRCGKIA